MTEQNPTGPVLLAAIPELPAAVWAQAARHAEAFGVSLLIAYVDVTRFVTYEDPDGTPHSTPIDLNLQSATPEIDDVRAAAERHLAGTSVSWEVRGLVGDPAMALKALAEKVDAELIVVGTRRRGFGESLREFFTGSVAARLAHRQQRPVLVVPLQEPVPDASADPWVE